MLRRLGHSVVRLSLATRFGTRALPLAGLQLARWEVLARAIPDGELRRQALSSLRLKRFHAEGGSVFGVAAPHHDEGIITLVVALQTISDYLDNLCDRGTSLHAADFRQLHRAMLDAVTPGRPRADYYALHPNREQGYLSALVEACREGVTRLPHFDAVAPRVIRYLTLYNDLQVYKHMWVPTREPALQAWFLRHRPGLPDIFWNEFAAASGSTLLVFALLVLAAGQRPARGALVALEETYFPWVCGLHILLDYLIDQEEDRLGGDLNLVSCYPDARVTGERLGLFLREARRRVEDLPDPDFHRLVVAGLPALYLADPKVARQGLTPLAHRLLAAAGPLAAALHSWCRLRQARGAGRSDTNN